MSEERLQRIEDLLTQLITKVSDISNVQKDMQKEQKKLKEEQKKMKEQMENEFKKVNDKIDDVAQSVKYLVHKMAEHDEMIWKIRDRINV